RSRPKAGDVGVARVEIEYLSSGIFEDQLTTNWFAVGQKRLVVPDEVAPVARRKLRSVGQKLIANRPSERGGKEALWFVAVKGGITWQPVSEEMNREQFVVNRPPVATLVSVADAVAQRDSTVPNHNDDAKHSQCASKASLNEV
ncbi:MAG: hypothetical protein EBW14_22235, partial [Oxalobacteraceae bacterium]|nr:hypothetical protein [Oxalobacteraceae bacterium]